MAWIPYTVSAYPALTLWDKIQALHKDAADKPDNVKLVHLNDSSFNPLIFFH